MMPTPGVLPGRPKSLEDHGAGQYGQPTQQGHGMNEGQLEEHGARQTEAEETCTGGDGPRAGRGPPASLPRQRGTADQPQEVANREQRAREDAQAARTTREPC